MKIDLTVVVLTKNEKDNIVSVIENAKQLTENVLIVDSGSTDGTVDIAKNCGAEVVFREWDNHFAAQRNFALEYVKTKWVLYLDADERMDKKLVSLIIKVIQDASKEKQYSMIRKICAFGFEYRFGILKPDEVLRLFPTNEVIWENKVHEKPVCRLDKELLGGHIRHYTYKDFQFWTDKANHYTSIWAKENYEKGKRISAASPFGRALYGFFSAYIIRLGILDGWAGLYSSLQHSIYTLMKYQKLYELQQKSK